MNIKKMLTAAMVTAGLLVSICGTGEIHAESSELTYADMADIKFYFASGGGGWATEMTIGEDGSFSGNHHDSEMGLTGDGYDATVYQCNFEGHLSDLTKVSEYAYSAKLTSLTQDKPENTTWIEDRVQYIESYPYGIYGADELVFYLPGTPKSELPETYITWASYLNKVEDTLSEYGIYNAHEETWFFGSVDQESQTNTTETTQAASPLQQRLAEVEQSAAALEEKYQAATDQNVKADIAGKLYTVWDDLLNEIWQAYPTQTQDNLRPAQIEWIKQKESTAQTISNPAESLYYTAQTTKERVYYLMQYV